MNLPKKLKRKNNNSLNEESMLELNQVSISHIHNDDQLLSELRFMLDSINKDCDDMIKIINGVVNED